jgi:hypothetical protein
MSRPHLRWRCCVRKHYFRVGENDDFIMDEIWLKLKISLTGGCFG